MIARLASPTCLSGGNKHSFHRTVNVNHFGPVREVVDLRRVALRCIRIVLMQVLSVGDDHLELWLDVSSASKLAALRCTPSHTVSNTLQSLPRGDARRKRIGGLDTYGAAGSFG